MSRRILCSSCDDKWKPHPQDVAEGWQYRVVHLVVKKPAKHVITVITDAGVKESPLPSILCDSCGEPINDGEIALAVTMWREGDMAEWEAAFGNVLLAAAAKMARTLSKENS
jgi:hypothetical protein